MQSHVITSSAPEFSAEFQNALYEHEQIVFPHIPQLESDLERIGQLTDLGPFAGFLYRAVPNNKRVAWNNPQLDLQFTPKGWVKVPVLDKELWCPLVWKVVRSPELSPLGLKYNPYELSYPLNDWAIDTVLHPNDNDDGGIWVTSSPGGAAEIERYMSERYQQTTTTFPTAILDPIYANHSETRFKVAGVRFLVAEP